MTTFLTFTILGLVLGAIYAIAASGLVLTYATSGIFNFAHGAQAMIGAFTFHQLHTTWGLPSGVAAFLVLGVLGPVMGLTLHAVIMRGLANVEEVTRIVVTVAVLLGLVSLSQWLWDPAEARVPSMFFGVDSTVDLGGVVLRYHEVLCLVVALVVAVGLRLLFTRSRLGMLMRATVDDPDLLRLSGHDPDRTAALAWVLGSSLAVLAGVLITPVTGGVLEANALTLLVINTFAAALFGRLRSIPLTFVGAIALGLATSYVVGYTPPTWTWAANVPQALPMALLFVVLLVLPQARLRGTAVRTRERYEVPSVRSAARWAAVLVVVVLGLRQLVSDSTVMSLQLGLAFAIVALSLVPLTGYAGELNLAPLAFCAVATIVAFHTGVQGTGLDARLSIGGLVAGVLAAAATGALVALPALRLRGLHLALATFAFGVLISTLVLRDLASHTVLGHTFTIFPNGNLIVPRLRVGPLDLADQDVFLVSTAAVFGVLGVGVVALRNSGYGRRLAAMKDSPAASAMLGQRLLRLKLSVFALSTAIAGLGGVFLAMALTSVSAEHFVFTISLSLVMLTVVGGIGYVSGALFGGVVAGTALTAIVANLNEVAAANPAYAGPLGTVSHLVLVATALVGIGVGKNPSGILSDVFAAHRRLARTPEVRYAAVAVQGGLYLLAAAEVLGTGWFIMLSLVLWLSLPALAARLRPRRLGLPPRPAPPELLGVDVPAGRDLVGQVDRRLGIGPLPAPTHHRPRPTTDGVAAPLEEETGHALA